MITVLFRLFCAFTLLITTNTMAFEWPFTGKEPNQSAQTQQIVTSESHVTYETKPTKKTWVNLYSHPQNDANIIKKISITTHLIPIFHKAGWVKVGDPKDGATGWISIKQYHTAKKRFFHNNVQDKTAVFYFHSEKNKAGKTTITAYRDGKKLSEKEAKKMYKSMQSQENKQWENMQRFENSMAFPQMFMPGIVIIDRHSDKKPHKNK